MLNTNVAATLPFDFCTITGRFDTAPDHHRSTFDGLADYLRSHVRLITMTREDYLKLSKQEQANVKDGPAIILATFKPDSRRADDNVERTTGIGLDIDEAHVDLTVLRVVFAGTAAIIYESANSTKDFRRWRVLIPYTQPATPAQHAQVFDYWRGKVQGIGAQSKNVSRLWYGVTRFAKGSERVFEVLHGLPFDPVTVPTLDPYEATQAAFRKIMPPANAPAAEGNRNDSLSRYAASVIRECSSYETLVASLHVINATYAPPLDVREVESIARRKWKGRQKFGWLPVVEEKPSYTHSDDDEAVGHDLNTLLDADVGEVPWIVEDTLTYGAHLLVGRPKGGKSWVTMDLCIACGNGGQFAGRQAAQCDVLWIAAEDTQASLARRLKVRNERGRNITIMTMESLKAERKRWDACSFDAWLRGYLEAHPDCKLVIVDTHKTCEAIWQAEQIDQRRSASIVDIAYQSVRLYDDIGQGCSACIVLVHHAGKMKHNTGTDYHERINLPATAVAGATASIVLADPDDRDRNDEDDHRRVLAMRGRHIIKEVPLLVELVNGRVKLKGEYRDIVQTDAQAEIFEAISLLLEEQSVCTIAQVAAQLGKHKNTVQTGLQRASKKLGGLQWKGRKLGLKASKGLYWE